VRDDPAENDNEAESRQTAAADVSQLLLGEAILPRPVHQDAAAHAEAHARREDGEEAGPQKPLCICRTAHCRGLPTEVVGEIALRHGSPRTPRTSQKSKRPPAACQRSAHGKHAIFRTYPRLE